MSTPNSVTKPDRLKPHPTLQDYYGHDEARPEYVRHLFDRAARDYDRIESGMAFGSGRSYRRDALRRAGLTTGMSVLDVAIGSGLVAREAVRLTGDRRRVVGLDPSAGMLAEARRQLGVDGIMGLGEALPVRSNSFDFLSMGYALRHLSDLTATFGEFLRVLKPGGTVCVLELTRPRGRVAYAALRFYMRRIVPFFTRLRTRNQDAELLMRYFWDTIDACVPPARIVAALAEAGFVEVNRSLAIGLFSEYTGRKPAPGESAPSRRVVDDSGNFALRIKRD